MSDGKTLGDLAGMHEGEPLEDVQRMQSGRLSPQGPAHLRVLLLRLLLSLGGRFFERDHRFEEWRRRGGFGSLWAATLSDERAARR